MLSKKILTVLAAASLTCLTASNGWAQTAVVTTTTSTTSSSSLSDGALVSRYTKFTGSTANAQSLVAGLRTGSAVTLVSTTSAPAVTFTPTTQDMGYGNINIALALAKTALAKQGIANPTPAQLAAALNGGSITLANGTVVTMAGVLTQRNSGMGWGKIAQSMDVKLGTIVSASNIDQANKENKTDNLAKAENAKNNHSSSDSGASNGKGSNASSSNSGGGSSNGGGSKSNAGGGNSGGGNSGGGNSGGGNGGGNSGGGKK